jgi:hypothetical protein
LRKGGRANHAGGQKGETERKTFHEFSKNERCIFNAEPPCWAWGLFSRENPSDSA